MFKKVDPKQSFPKMEEAIVKFWEEKKIFEKSVEKNSADKSFVFYEGPPTANGKPGLHHVLARAFKDVIPRYKTMKGYRVERKAGWDTHGLPVELQVEKDLGLKNKQDIENIVPGNKRQSIIEFNKKCKESVWKYKDLWEKLTRRMGYWVDMQNPYVTYENKYIESVWWTVAQIFKTKNDKGENLVYRGHKVVPYCYRCGTALSSHEVAQGYQIVKENSVYIKFKAKPNPEKGIDDNTYFLAWTTTPWTLPGNVALAVNRDIDYVIYEGNRNANGNVETYIASLDYYLKKYPPSKILEERPSEFPHEKGRIEGKKLLNFEYENLYDANNTDKKAYFVVAGDEFIETLVGTGIVHIAPAFGEDDADIGRENNLPTLITVDETGKIIADVPGKGIPVKKKNEKNKYAVDELIMEDLKKRGLFFKEEMYEHEYPFCWRCNTPLIYYAKPSWFIRMSELAGDLVKNNENINWIPENIKEGRFGEWLRGVKDWAISRERYWGTPLPLWQCEKCEKTKVIESIEEIREQLGNPNKLFLVRHGEAENNVKNIESCLPEIEKYPMTEKGKEDVKKMAQELKTKKIDMILASPVCRTKETAEIISKELGVEIVFDDRLREWDLGNYNNKMRNELAKSYPNWFEDRKKDKEGVEGLVDVLERMQSILNEINSKNKGKNIAIVSHGDPLLVLELILLDKKKEDIKKIIYPEKGKYLEFYSFIFDLHKPFIDDVKLKCSCGGEMKRTPEVLDVWFDSGSMPLAQYHYPNGATKEDKQKVESGKYFPADFISEAIDQTRGWFYTLHAIANLLWKAGKVSEGRAFKNVICLGHIVDAQGKKMSKSKGNIVDPMEIMNEYSADMLRYLLYTINQPGLTKRFDVKSMKDVMNRVFRMLWNSYYFFVMYANVDKIEIKDEKLKVKNNLLDRWIISEIQILIMQIELKLDSYEIYEAAGLIEKFIDNLSNWYIRRSRRRFWKSESDEDKAEAYGTLHYVLVTLAKLMAPFTPFISEEIYRNLTGKESVHLVNFPAVDKSFINGELILEMHKVRSCVNDGLRSRAEAGIKVRQPLKAVSLKYQISNKELINIIKEELNVKEVVVDKTQKEEIKLDTKITKDLKLEGQAREMIRFIQEMRKEAGYKVDNRIQVGYKGLQTVFDKFGKIIAKETLATELKGELIAEADLQKSFKVDEKEIEVSIKR